MLEIPNLNTQISNKSQIQISKFQTFWFIHLNFGHWCLFGVWSLEFVISLLLRRSRGLPSKISISGKARQGQGKGIPSVA
jgi:hypothetical protein